MSCSDCDCEECVRSRTMNDFDDDEEEEVPSIPFGRLPPPPPFHRSTDEFRVAMHSVFDQYPTARINMPAVVSVMMQRLNVKPHEFREAESQIVGFIKGQADAGVLNLTKGKNGGIMRPSLAEQVKAKIEVKRTIAGPVRSVGETIHPDADSQYAAWEKAHKVESPLQSASSVPTINDHTCPHCGNTSCSKSEKSCWKCGNAL